MRMLDAVTEERIRVRYGETDQMGHAYYANYLLWFEQARGAWCRDRGFTYKGIEESGYKLPVVEVWVRYRGEIKYDDTIRIDIHLAEIKRSSMKFEYEIVNETTGKSCTEGYSWHVLVEDGMKAVAIPSDIRDLLMRDPAEHSSLA